MEHFPDGDGTEITLTLGFLEEAVLFWELIWSSKKPPGKKNVGDVLAYLLGETMKEKGIKKTYLDYFYKNRTFIT